MPTGVFPSRSRLLLMVLRHPAGKSFIRRSVRFAAQSVARSSLGAWLRPTEFRRCCLYRQRRHLTRLIGSCLEQWTQPRSFVSRSAQSAYGPRRGTFAGAGGLQWGEDSAASLRQGTGALKPHLCGWRTWIGFCASLSWKPGKPLMGQMLDFLASLAEGSYVNRGSGRVRSAKSVLRGVRFAHINVNLCIWKLLCKAFWSRVGWRRIAGNRNVYRKLYRYPV